MLSQLEAPKELFVSRSLYASLGQFESTEQRPQLYNGFERLSTNLLQTWRIEVAQLEARLISRLEARLDQMEYEQGETGLVQLDEACSMAMNSKSSHKSDAPTCGHLFPFREHVVCNRNLMPTKTEGSFQLDLQLSEEQPRQVAEANNPNHINPLMLHEHHCRKRSLSLLATCVILLFTLITPAVAAASRHFLVTGAHAISGVASLSTSVALIPLQYEPDIDPLRWGVRAMWGIFAFAFLVLTYQVVPRNKELYLFASAILAVHFIALFAQTTDTAMEGIATFGPLLVIVCSMLVFIPFRSILAVGTSPLTNHSTASPRRASATLPTGLARANENDIEADANNIALGAIITSSTGMAVS